MLYEGEAAPTCYCPKEFWGDTCQYKRGMYMVAECPNLKRPGLILTLTKGVCMCWQIVPKSSGMITRQYKGGIILSPIVPKRSGATFDSTKEVL